MCSIAVARRDWDVYRRRTDVAEVCRVLVSGLAAGGAGAALFIVIHSLLIVPIWTRSFGHMPFALAAGVGLALAYEEAATAPRLRTATGGLRFGVAIFATLAPATIFTNVLRAVGAPASGWAGLLGTLALATWSDGAAGWLMTKRVAGAVRFPAATLALTIAMGGTIAVVNGPRAGLLFVGFVPICAGSGLALAAARRCLTSRESS